MSEARSYQAEFLRTFRPILVNWRTAPVKRAMLVWHRRAGKDFTALNFVDWAMKTRPGTYFHFLPTYAQAKKIVWNGQTREGQPFLKPLLESPLFIDKHETELRVTYRAVQGQQYGATYQLVGGDSIDNIVGTNPVGCIFSEYPLMNPRAWDLVRPILAENGGWALFVFTPRGKNHAWDLWDGVKDDPKWFRSLKTVNDTHRDADGEDGLPIMTKDDVESEIRAGMSRELAAQEFYCSWEGALEGAYYADQMGDALKEGRIGEVPWIKNLPVDTAWDIGIQDHTAIWFTQTVSPTRLHVIDYVEASNVSLEQWIKFLGQKPYRYGSHYWPHDGEVRNWETGNTRVQFAATKGVNFDVQPKLSPEDGIDAARRLLPICHFDAKKASRGLDCLRAYHREKDDKLGTWKATPTHDWSSHGADAWRTRAVAWRANLGGGSQPLTGWRPTEKTARKKLIETAWRDSGYEQPYTNTDVEWGEEWWGKRDDR